MSDPYDELPFNGLTLEQRLMVALKQTTAVAKELAPFLVTLQPGRAPDPKLQREAVSRGLEAVRDLLKTLLLDELLAAGITHKFGRRPNDDAPDDAHCLHAIRELHFTIEALGEAVMQGSIGTIQADLVRLVDRHAPQVLKRDYYVDARERDKLELMDREFAVLLTYFVAEKQQTSISALLKRLDVGVEYDAFRQWARAVDREQRELVREAGKQDAGGGGLTLAQAARLSERSQAVLLRDDRDRYPTLADLSDEEKLSLLFARVQRSGPFSRPPAIKRSRSGQRRRNGK